VRLAALALAAASAFAAPRPAGNWGLLVLCYGDNGQFRREIPALRQLLPGVPIESVDLPESGPMQRAVDKLKAQRAAKIVAVPLDPVSESPAMNQTRYLFGIRPDPTEDRPDGRKNPGDAPGFKNAPKSGLVLERRGRARRIKTDASTVLVLAATIDRSSVLSSVLAERALAQTNKPAKDAVLLVGMAPLSDYALENWKSAAAATAEQVRVKGGFREAAVAWVRESARPSQNEADATALKETLRGLVIKGGVVAVPMAPDGKRVGLMLKRLAPSGAYRWNGKGFLGERSTLEWIRDTATAASTLPDVRQYRD
jgi:hypothetical protein